MIQFHSRFERLSRMAGFQSGSRLLCASAREELLSNTTDSITPEARADKLTAASALQHPRAENQDDHFRVYRSLQARAIPSLSTEMAKIFRVRCKISHEIKRFDGDRSVSASVPLTSHLCSSATPPRPARGTGMIVDGVLDAMIRPGIAGPALPVCSGCVPRHSCRPESLEPSTVRRMELPRIQIGIH